MIQKQSYELYARLIMREGSMGYLWAASAATDTELIWG